MYPLFQIFMVEYLMGQRLNIFRKYYKSKVPDLSFFMIPDFREPFFLNNKKCFENILFHLTLLWTLMCIVYCACLYKDVHPLQTVFSVFVFMNSVCVFFAGFIFPSDCVFCKCLYEFCLGFFRVYLPLRLCDHHHVSSGGDIPASSTCG